MVIYACINYEYVVDFRRRFLAGKTAQRQQSGPRSAKSQIAHQLSTVLPARVCSSLDGDDQVVIEYAFFHLIWICRKSMVFDCYMVLHFSDYPLCNKQEF